MYKLFIAALLVAGFTFAGTISADAHCGTCGVEGEKAHGHSHDIKPYVKGETECCSAEHFAETQKKAIAEQAKADYKEGDCCSAEHSAEKKVKKAEKAALMSEYKKGETKCCSAEHYAKEKMKAAKKDK